MRPSLSEEGEVCHLDWDQTLVVSARTRATLTLLMLQTLDECGTQGQLMWPSDV